MKILLVGGGTAGSVSPLLAVHEEIIQQNKKSQFLFVGTKSGPEKIMAENLGVPFVSIFAGKWRRYFSVQNLLTPVFVLIGIFQSYLILKKFRPDVVFGAGSFVQVPLIFIAWVLKIPVLLHQQDIIPSLANSICQFFAKKITVTFEASLKDFSSGLGFFKKNNIEKVVWTGNPFRENYKLVSREQAISNLKLNMNFPVLLVLGGGTGAKFLNDLIYSSLPELTKTVQVLHATGKGKGKNIQCSNYQAWEFISDMGSAYSACDIVLCRAGISTITELSNLGKVSIIVPIPNSHQEINAMYLAQTNASIVLLQEQVNSENLIMLVRKLLFEYKLQKELQKNIIKILPKFATKKVCSILLELKRD